MWIIILSLNLWVEYNSPLKVSLPDENTTIIKKKKKSNAFISKSHSNLNKLSERTHYTYNGVECKDFNGESS